MFEKYKPIDGNYLFWNLAILHSRELYNGSGEAIHPTIVAVNIPICYKYTYQS